MIFYGTKGKHLKSEKARAKQCNQCNEQTTHTISIFGRYFYIYWIPVFPLTKKGVAECDTCKTTLAPKEMNEQLRLEYDNIKRETKTPLTFWTGSLVLIGLISFFIYSGSKHKEDVIDFIANPQKGDVIDYKPSDFYSTLKVTEVTNDSVFFVRNNYEIERKSKLYKIDKEKNYSTAVYSLSRNEYQTMFDKKEFLDVDR